MEGKGDYDEEEKWRVKESMMRKRSTVEGTGVHDEDGNYWKRSQ